MSSAVAIVFALEGGMFLGLVVLLTGLVQTVRARRRGAAVRAPLIASGAGFVIVLAAAVTLGVTGVLHLMTFVTYSSLR